MTKSELIARTARLDDAAAVTAIYNQGIEDRIGTFETEPRELAQIEAWFPHAKAFVVVEDEVGDVVGYAVAHPYADRCCYAGIGEFSVYIRRDQRGRSQIDRADAAERGSRWERSRAKIQVGVEVWRTRPRGCRRRCRLAQARP